MAYQFVRTDDELKTFLTRIRSAKWIAFDTEFLSEGKYRLELCLVQVAADDMIALIDPFGIKDLTPFWKRLCDVNTMTIVHSGRTEMEFCFKAIGRLPRNLFDVQLASGFVSCDYPLSFKSLGDKILHLDFPKGETRTNWLHRPLSLLQIEYAINDVFYLKDMADKLEAMLLEQNRLQWYNDERDVYLDNLMKTFTREPWLELSGLHGFSSVQLGIVRDLWYWRKEEATRTHLSPGRILRDDLLLELAKRKSSDPARILAVRGLERQKKYIEPISEIIARALSFPESELPPMLSTSNYPHYTVATQFLMTVLTDFAKVHDISVSLLSPLHDVRDYIARFYGTLPSHLTTRLTQGWRAELLGTLLSDLLQGKKAIKLLPFNSERPIELVSIPDDF